MKIAAIVLVVVSWCDCTEHLVSAEHALRSRRAQSGVTTSELAANNSPTSCWIQIDANAYDVTAYYPSHPAGPDSILNDCGSDVTTRFYAQASHSAALLGMPGIVNKGAVSAGAPPPTQAPVPAPTNRPATPPPVPAPTNRPVAAPTNRPVAAPTNPSPVQKPPTQKPVTAQSPVQKPSAAPAQTTVNRPGGACAGMNRLTIMQVKRSDRCLVVIFGNVYNFETYKHPGGQAPIRRNCNTDGTIDYAEHHNRKKLKFIKHKKIGVLRNGIQDPCRGKNKYGHGGKKSKSRKE